MASFNPDIENNVNAYLKNLIHIHPEWLSSILLGEIPFNIHDPDEVLIFISIWTLRANNQRDCGGTFQEQIKWLDECFYNIYTYCGSTDLPYFQVVDICMRKDKNKSYMLDFEKLKAAHTPISSPSLSASNTIESDRLFAQRLQTQEYVNYGETESLPPM